MTELTITDLPMIIHDNLESAIGNIGESEAIKLLQKCLNKYIAYQIPITGILDEETFKLIKLLIIALGVRKVNDNFCDERLLDCFRTAESLKANTSAVIESFRI